MRPCFPLILGPILLVIAGCGERESSPPIEATPAIEPTAGWPIVEVSALTELQMAQKSRAMEAGKALGGRLLGELEEALDSHGPADAVEVCRALAPLIAAEVGMEHSLALGRTSFRLRNSANTPPAWARDSVDAMTPGPLHFAGPGGELGMLMPILLQAECTMCHGTDDQRSDEAMDAIRRLYPGDEAVGFSEGDLRGWLWVEVPAEVGDR
jgi:hypothetical protein